MVDPFAGPRGGFLAIENARYPFAKAVAAVDCASVRLICGTHARRWPSTAVRMSKSCRGFSGTERDPDA